MIFIQRSKEKRNERKKETEEKYKEGEERHRTLTIEEIMFVHTLHSFAIIMCHTFLQKDWKYCYANRSIHQSLEINNNIMLGMEQVKQKLGTEGAPYKFTLCFYFCQQLHIWFIKCCLFSLMFVVYTDLICVPVVHVIRLKIWIRGLQL